MRVESRRRAESRAVGNGTFGIVTVRVLVPGRRTTLRTLRAVTRYVTPGSSSAGGAILSNSDVSGPGRDGRGGGGAVGDSADGGRWRAGGVTGDGSGTAEGGAAGGRAAAVVSRRTVLSRRVLSRRAALSAAAFAPITAAIRTSVESVC